VRRLKLKTQPENFRAAVDRRPPPISIMNLATQPDGEQRNLRPGRFHKWSAATVIQIAANASSPLRCPADGT
jgi:hypothetical protein